MSDRYLWDRSGEPDAEIARLEQALAPLRLQPPPAVGEATAPVAGDHRTAPRRRWARPALAGAAGLMAAAAMALWLSARPSPVLPTPPTAPVLAGPAPAAAAPEPWTVAPLAGSPRVAKVALQTAGPVSTGAVVETDGHSRARISMGDIGQVELDRGTRVRLVSAGNDRHRLGLERGVLHALIWAPAGRFDVETPAGVVTDLGCAYTLAVDDEGGGEVTVSSGWVGFEYRGRESLIPAGASARLQQGRGPGTPMVPGSPRPLRQLVKAVDEGVVVGGAGTPRSLRQALAAARPEDVVTLWHLLARVPEAWRGPVHDRLARLAPPPAGVDRRGIVAGDPRMHDQWWDALDYGPIADWRRWKASASPVQ